MSLLSFLSALDCGVGDQLFPMAALAFPRWWMSPGIVSRYKSSLPSFFFVSVFSHRGGNWTRTGCHISYRAGLPMAGRTLKIAQDKCDSRSPDPQLSADRKFPSVSQPYRIFDMVWCFSGNIQITSSCIHWVWGSRGTESTAQKQQQPTKGVIFHLKPFTRCSL